MINAPMHCFTSIEMLFDLQATRIVGANVCAYVENISLLTTRTQGVIYITVYHFVLVGAIDNMQIKFTIFKLFKCICEEICDCEF